jgi:hypothetical protein
MNPPPLDVVCMPTSPTLTTSAGEAIPLSPLAYRLIMALLGAVQILEVSDQGSVELHYGRTSMSVQPKPLIRLDKAA